MSTPNAELSADEVATKLEQAVVSTTPQWRRVWQGSDPQRGWSIVAGRDPVAYLGGDESMGDAVDRIIEAHNTSVTQTITVNPELLMDLALPDDMEIDERDDIRQKVFGAAGNAVGLAAAEFQRLARKLGWAG